MSGRSESVGTWTLAIAALAVVGMMAKDRLVPKVSRLPEGDVVHLEDWKQAQQVSTPVSGMVGRTSILEFLDLECPFCAVFDSTMRALERTLGDFAHFSVVHMPIAGHKFARSGALAIECAAAQKRGREFISHVLAKQDSIGLKSWADFAYESAVADTSTFRECTSSAGIAANVDSAIAISRKLKIPGTPSILIGGWRFSASHSYE